MSLRDWKIEKKKTLQHCIRYLLTWKRISQVRKCNQDFNSSPVSPFPLPTSLPPFSPPPSSNISSTSTSALKRSFLTDAQSHTQDSPLDAPHFHAFEKSSTQFWGYFIWFLVYILHDFPLIPLSITWLVPGNSAQCYVASWMGREFGGEWIHGYIWLSLLKLAKHC